MSRIWVNCVACPRNKDVKHAQANPNLDQEHELTNHPSLCGWIRLVYLLMAQRESHMHNMPQPYLGAYFVPWIFPSSLGQNINAFRNSPTLLGFGQYLQHARSRMAAKLFVLMLWKFISFVRGESGTFLGFAYQAPLGSSETSTCQATASDLDSALRSILTSGQSPYGDYTPNATSVSMKLTSAVDGSTLFAFDFTANNLEGSTDKTSEVNENSIFRIGSVSKLLTVYAFILNHGYDYWDRAITEFVPELREAVVKTAIEPVTDRVRWEEVTLGSLCSQLSGIGRDCQLSC